MMEASTGQAAYIWDHASLSSAHAASLPWPVLYVLAQHPKTIHSVRRPSFDTIARAGDRWMQGQLWRQYFSDAAAYDAMYGTPSRQQDQDRLIWRIRTKLPTVECFHEMAKVRNPCQDLVNELTAAAGEAIITYKS